MPQYNSTGGLVPWAGYDPTYGTYDSYQKRAAYRQNQFDVRKNAFANAQAGRAAQIAAGTDPYKLADRSLRNPDGRPTYGLSGAGANRAQTDPSINIGGQQPGNQGGNARLQQISDQVNAEFPGMSLREKANLVQQRYGGGSNTQLNSPQNAQQQNSPYPTSPYKITNPSGQGFTSEGQQFTISGYNPDGTKNWTRSDGTQFNNLSESEFAKFFGPGAAQFYYGKANANVDPNARFDRNVSNQPMPAALSGETPLADAALQGFGMGLAPFQTDYLNQVGQSLWSQAGQQWNDVINPSLNDAAIKAGGYGGDRTNLAKGVAADRLNQSVFNAMAPQYAQSYDKWLDRGVGTGQAAGNLLGNLGALDVSAYNAQTNAGSAAAGAAGVPQYTNPWATGIGTTIGLAQLLNLFNQG